MHMAHTVDDLTKRSEGRRRLNAEASPDAPAQCPRWSIGDERAAKRAPRNVDQLRA
jgi:hypothetical protein